MNDFRLAYLPLDNVHKHLTAPTIFVCVITLVILYPTFAFSYFLTFYDDIPNMHTVLFYANSYGAGQRTNALKLICAPYYFNKFTIAKMSQMLLHHMKIKFTST